MLNEEWGMGYLHSILRKRPNTCIRYPIICVAI